MGGNHNKYPINPYQQECWFEAQRKEDQIFCYSNKYSKRILVNLQNNQMIEEYQVNFLTQQQYLKFCNDLLWRQNTDQDSSYYVYPSKIFKDKTKKEFCSSIYQGLLYLEMVEVTLKEINDISLNDSLYLIKAMILGFQYLYEKVGYIYITEDMVFIDTKGCVKVWMNPNLSLNQPNFMSNQDTSQSIIAAGSQSQMIMTIIRNAEINIDPNEETMRFSKYLKNLGIHQRIFFDQALQQLQHYAISIKRNISNCIQSIRQLFKQDNFTSEVCAVSQVRRVNSIIYKSNAPTKRSLAGKSIIKRLNTPLDISLISEFKSQPQSKYLKSEKNQKCKFVQKRQAQKMIIFRNQGQIQYLNRCRSNQYPKRQLQNTLERGQLSKNISVFSSNIFIPAIKVQTLQGLHSPQKLNNFCFKSYQKGFHNQNKIINQLNFRCQHNTKQLPPKNCYSIKSNDNPLKTIKLVKKNFSEQQFINNEKQKQTNYNQSNKNKIFQSSFSCTSIQKTRQNLIHRKLPLPVAYPKSEISKNFFELELQQKNVKSKAKHRLNSFLQNKFKRRKLEKKEKQNEKLNKSIVFDKNEKRITVEKRMHYFNSKNQIFLLDKEIAQDLQHFQQQ